MEVKTSMDIIFADRLIAYTNEVVEISTEVEVIRSKLLLAHSMVEDTWKGAAAESCKEKILEIQEELSKSDEMLFDVENRLGIVDNNIE